MASPFRVPLAITDAALQLLYEAHADLMRTTAVPPVGRMKTSGVAGRLRAQDPNQVRAQGTYLRMVSVVEAFVDTLSSQAFRHRIDEQDDLVVALVNAAEARADTSWSERKSAFQTYHGVNLGSCHGWTAVESSHLVRNAIAHGLGSLTRRQANKGSRSKVRGAGVVLVDDVIWITDASLARCRDSSATFVRDVDAKVRRSLTT